MDEVLYKSLDAATRRRYDANLLKHKLKEEHEYQVRRQAKEDMKSSVWWFVLYIGLLLVVIFVFLAIVFQNTAFTLPFALLFCGMLLTLY
jgi:uncharacterized integral membrane protein